MTAAADGSAVWLGARLAWRRWMLLPGLALWVALVRLPTFRLMFGDFDEGFFLLAGQSWNQGHLPYDAIWDVKPPGLFALFALAQRLAGPGLLASRLLASVAVLASSLCLYRFARHHLVRRADDLSNERRRDDWLPVAAALLYPAYSMAMYGTYTRSELLLAPLVIGGFDLVLRYRRCGRPDLARAATAGLLFGAAIMIKQTAACELALAGLLVASAGIGETRSATRRHAGRAALAAAASFAAAAALPTLGFLAYLAAHGVAAPLLLAPFLGAARRLGGDGLTFGEGLLHFLPMSVPTLPLMIAACMLLLGERRRTGRLCRNGEAVWLVYGWLAAALAAVLAMRAMYPGYFQPLVPPLLLLTLLLLRLVDDQLRAAAGTRAIGRAIPLGLVLLIGLYPGSWVRWSGGEGAWANLLPTRAAERLRAEGLTSASTLWVANADPVLYLLAGVQPPTRFAFPQHLTCDFTLPERTQRQEVERILAGQPDFIALARTQNMRCQRDDKLAPIDAALASGYRLADTVQADGQSLALYRRRKE